MNSQISHSAPIMTAKQKAKKATVIGAAFSRSPLTSISINSDPTRPKATAEPPCSTTSHHQ
ncbi:hypothetical protein D3C87_1863300 [compost metagenome]